ncbi:MAG: protein kinase [Candidatus Sericytochromatia bacterium]
MQVNQRVTPSQVERQTSPTIGQTRATPAPPQQAKPSAFSHPTDPTLAHTPELSEAETATIQQQVSHAHPESLAQEAESLPQPGSLQEQLQKQAGQLKHVETGEIHDRSGLQQSARQEFIADARHDQGLLKETTLETHEVARVHHEASLAPLAELAQAPVAQYKQEHLKYQQAYLKYAQSGQARDFLAGQLQTALKDLDKADTLIGGDANIAKSVAKTRAQVKTLVASLSSELNFSVYLGHQTDDQLRQLIMDSIGQSKGYDLSQTAQLSPKKLKLVEAVLKGIKAGLPEQRAQGLDLKHQPVPVGHRGELSRARAQIQLSPEIQARIQTAIGAHAHGSDMLWTLTLKSDDELAGLLDQQLGGGVPKAFLQAMVATIHQSLPDRLSSSLTDTGHGMMPETIQINGKTYAQPSYLAAGAFGKVFAYVNPDDPQDKVVVKQQIPPDEGSAKAMREETVNELIAHREILGEGHENIIGLRGAIKSPDNQILIVLDFAAGGNMYQASQKLDASLGSGLISADARHLLGKFLLQGVLEGTRHMQETRQAHHGDFKSPNILIGADGKAKLTDFGTSGVGHMKAMTANPVDNPAWLSPELGKQNFHKLASLANLQPYHALYQDHREALDAAFASIKDKDMLGRLDKASQRFTNQFLKDAYPEIHAELIGSGINNLQSQLKTRYPEIADLIQGRVKMHISQSVLDHLKEHKRFDTRLLASMRQTFQDLENHHLKGDKPMQGTAYTHYLKLEQDYLQAHAPEVGIARSDTWSAGIVAAELLITSHAQQGAKAFQHIGEKMNLGADKTSFTLARILEFASQDKRMMERSSDLNIQTLAASQELSIPDLARAYATDPRFQGPDYAALFTRLQQAPPAEQDLQQFKAVLQTEMDMGVSAQDRLINGLCHPDPAKRITMQAAMQNSIFSDPRLAMPELTELWQEVNSKTPDPAKIQTLIKALGV